MRDTERRYLDIRDNFSEMLSNELLSELHGQVSLNAVHRFFIIIIVIIVIVII